MMKITKTVILCNFFCFAIVFANGQTIKDGFTGEMDFYKSNSKQVRDVVRFFQDTTYLLFGCDSMRKIAFWYDSQRYETLGEISMSPINLINSSTLSKLIESDFVILIVDSVDIFIRQWLLFNSPLKDSIEYIGKRNYDLKYENFENCVNSYGANLIIHFLCLPNTPMKIVRCGFYIPLEVRKKLKIKDPQ